MDFFTYDAYDTWSETGDGEKLLVAHKLYENQLDRLKGIFPKALLELAHLKNIDDALMLHVNHDRIRRKLILKLRCGDSEKGYFDLILRYAGARLFPDDDLALAQVARSVNSQDRHGCDLAFHEIDLNQDGLIEHRFIFHALKWHYPLLSGRIAFTIRCQHLTWRIVPRCSRRITSCKDRYPNGPAT